MWKRYFGPLAKIISLDIRPECSAFSDDQVHVRIGDQSDIGFLSQILSELGAPDIVLDDGSHQMHHVIATFKFLYEKTAPNGVYLIEDMHSSYWLEYGGGLKREGSFIELCKQLIDELNADHITGVLRPPSITADAPKEFLPTSFTRQTRCISFYDSLVAFERGVIPAIAKRSVATGDLSLPIG